jgi:hypothetical protein
VNRTQESVSKILGNGSGGRADYSNYAVQRPKTQEQLDRLRHAAHEEGPGGEAWDAYHATLQQGLDRDLPSATGGVPRSIAETGRLLNEAADSATEYFVQAPAILNNFGWQGRSFADLGPAESRRIVAEQVAQALPHERAQWYEVAQALDNATTSTLGIQYQTDEGPVLQYEAPSDTQGDPSGYQQYLESKGMTQDGLNGLMLKAQDNALYDGLSNYSAGGGTYSHYEAQQLAAYRSGQLTQQEGDFHQADANTFTNED